MACMEHVCVRCGNLEFNNESRRRVPCHKCGCTRWVSTFDEPEAKAEHDKEMDDAEPSDDTD